MTTIQQLVNSISQNQIPGYSFQDGGLIIEGKSFISISMIDPNSFSFRTTNLWSSVTLISNYLESEGLAELQMMEESGDPVTPKAITLCEEPLTVDEAILLTHLGFVAPFNPIQEIEIANLLNTLK